MEKNPTIAFVLGTRPEIIKLSPLIRLCEGRNISYILIHTGQHYSDTLDNVFFDRLRLPEPDYNLGVGSNTHGKQTGDMIIKIDQILLDEKPGHVIVQGDTNSTLAGGLTASKMDSSLSHVEAGLRSGNEEMPEEINRRIVDHVASNLFPPTEVSKKNLINEGIREEKIQVTGNTIVDAVEENIKIAQTESKILDRIDASAGNFILMTMHRSENVDNAARFKQILSGISTAAKALSLPVLYPIHPRSEKRIEEFDINVPSEITLIEPLGYLDFLLLESSASLIVTDSGGVQEEACILETPCVTIRTETERPETVSAGANKVAGVQPKAIASAIEDMNTVKHEWENPYGDGTASEKILNTIL